MELSTPSDRAIRVRRVTHDGVADAHDLLAAEEPLGILLTWPGRDEPFELVMTMRTPGDDADLVAGYLRGEGIVGDGVALTGTHTQPGVPGEASQIIARLSAPPTGLDERRRASYASSSCGLCGRASVAAVAAAAGDPAEVVPGAWSADLIRSLPDRMRAEQEVFERTGGLHAAALFGADGGLRALAEDIGRHNAVDKVIGRMHLAGERISGTDILAVSGRAGFEIVQKAALAGIAGMAAVGAPSSLAVELARRAGMTLMGFVRGGRFNVYCGVERLALRGGDTP